MYIHLHTIGLTGVTELGTVTFHFAPNLRRFHWSISRWILLIRKNIFGKSFKSSFSFICAEFQICLTFSKHDIIILVGIFHGNRSLTSYVSNETIVFFSMVGSNQSNLLITVFNAIEIRL